MRERERVLKEERGEGHSEMLPLLVGWLVGYVACGKADKGGVAKDMGRRDG